MHARRIDFAAVAKAVVFFIFAFPHKAFASESGEPRQAADHWRQASFCGVNATYLLLKLRGREASLDELQRDLRVDRGGSTLKDMRDALRKHGFPCNVVKATYAQMWQCGFPSIAHVESDAPAEFYARGRGHFVVLLGVENRGTDRESVQYIDATTAVISVRPAAEFRREWSGYLLAARSWRLFFHGALIAVAATGLVGASWWAAFRKHRRARFAVPRAFFDERGSSATRTKRTVSTNWGELLTDGVAWRRLALATGMVCACEASRGAEQPLPTPAEVSERIAEKMRKLHALSMEVEIKREPRADAKALRKWLSKAPLRNDVEEIAFKGGKRHLRHEEAPINWTMEGMERPEVDPAASAAVQASQREQQRQFDQAVETNRLARSIDGKDKLPKNKSRLALHRTTAFNGVQLRRFDELGARGYICAARSPLKHQFGSLYLSSVGIYLDDPALSEAENRQQRAAFLPEAIARGAYKSSADTLGEVSCMRLEGAAASDTQPGIFESWWLDLDHALMVRRRELLDSPRGNVLMRVTNSAPKEVVPGVWLPMESEMQEFAPANAPRDLRKGPLVVTSLRVRKSSVDVADETFDLRFPPGTVVADGALAEAEGLGAGAAIEYIMPADAGQLDAVAREALKRYQGGMLRRRWWWWPLAATVGAVVLWLAFGRFKRRAGAPREGAHG